MRSIFTPVSTTLAKPVTSISRSAPIPPRQFTNRFDLLIAVQPFGIDGLIDSKAFCHFQPSIKYINYDDLTGTQSFSQMPAPYMPSMPAPWITTVSPEFTPILSSPPATVAAAHINGEAGLIRHTFG